MSLAFLSSLISTTANLSLFSHAFPLYLYLLFLLQAGTPELFAQSSPSLWEEMSERARTSKSEPYWCSPYRNMCVYKNKVSTHEEFQILIVFQKQWYIVFSHLAAD